MHMLMFHAKIVVVTRISKFVIKYFPMRCCNSYKITLFTINEQKITPSVVVYLPWPVVTL